MSQRFVDGNWAENLTQHPQISVGGGVPEVPGRAPEVKQPILSTVWEGGGWINGNSVGLDPEERILGCYSAWLMRTRLIMELSTPKLGGVNI